jgi:membrane protease YdiL (CAAX protease family)
MSDTRPCEPWKFWASTAWAAGALLAWVAAQFIIAGILLVYVGLLAGAAPKGAEEQSLFVLLVAIGSAPAPIAGIALAVRLARCRFSDYLAFVWPRRHDFLIGLACVVVLLPLGDLASHLSGRDVVPPFVVEAYKNAAEGGTLILLALAFTVAAPLMEEVIFRGFLLPGYFASRIGAANGIALSSAAWAAMHVQYEFFFIVQIFILGLVFGWLRWRSGSTLLTLILHAMINLSALVQTAIIVNWMS